MELLVSETLELVGLMESCALEWLIVCLNLQI